MDLSLLAFVKIIIAVKNNSKIAVYNQTKKLEKRMPGYTVKLGFGLHIGWAIEGAIGSTFKIDASYLSPHVNITSWLEESTKMYGVPLLFSGKIYKLLSRNMRRKVRLLDKVAFKSADKPMSIFIIIFY